MSSSINQRSFAICQWCKTANIKGEKEITMSRSIYLVAYYKNHDGEVNYSPEWMNRDNISYDEEVGKIYLGSITTMLHQISPNIEGIFLKKDIGWDDEGGLSAGYHWYGHPDALMQLLCHPDMMLSHNKNWSPDFLQEFFAHYKHSVIAIQVC